MAFETRVILPPHSRLITMSIEEKAELIIAIRNYTCQNRKARSDGIDFTVSDPASGEIILVRLIEPQGQARFVGVDEVKKMLNFMKSQSCDRGILISKRFTVAALNEMAQDNIQQVSDEYMPPFKIEELYNVINNHIETLCKAKCGDIALKESDCQKCQEKTSCRIKAINRNAVFHFERCWMNLLKDDLKQLLSLNKSVPA